MVVGTGAYLLIKLQPVLALSPVTDLTLQIIGTITAIGASLVAIAQIDIKRAFSHSTSAYLGLVFIAVGEGHVDIALLLLFTHAIAKALLFMSVGSIIVTTSTQDLTENSRFDRNGWFVVKNACYNYYFFNWCCKYDWGVTSGLFLGNAALD